MPVLPHWAGLTLGAVWGIHISLGALVEDSPELCGSGQAQASVYVVFSVGPELSCYAVNAKKCVVLLVRLV